MWGVGGWEGGWVGGSVGAGPTPPPSPCGVTEQWPAAQTAPEDGHHAWICWGGGVGVRGHKTVCVPTIGLQFPAPFLVHLLWGWRGWVCGGWPGPPPKAIACSVPDGPPNRRGRWWGVALRALPGLITPASLPYVAIWMPLRFGPPVHNSPLACPCS